MFDEKLNLDNLFPRKDLDLIDKFAIGILQGLMKRYKEPGYNDGSAIAEAYSLAIDMNAHRIYLEKEGKL